MRSRRAILYMPGDDMHKITKATTLGVDSICMDLEDGVAINRKSVARQTIVQALSTLDFGNCERLVRINSIGSGLEGEDLSTILPTHPDGIVIPKVQNAQHIAWVNQYVTSMENEFGWAIGSIGLIAIVESALGIINLREIASSDTRLQALIFGADDLAGDIGAIRTTPGWEVFYARSAVVTFASAFNLQAIDMVFTNINDLDGLRQEALQGAQMGFSGKQIIHPNQVIPVQNTFTPSPEAIDQATRVIRAFEEYQKHGTGAFALDGKMIDAPIIKIAQRVLQRAECSKHGSRKVSDP